MREADEPGTSPTGASERGAPSPEPEHTQRQRKPPRSLGQRSQLRTTVVLESASVEEERELPKWRRRSARGRRGDGVAELEESRVDVGSRGGDVEDLHTPTAAVAGLDIDAEDAAKEPGPEMAAARGRAFAP